MTFVQKQRWLFAFAGFLIFGVFFYSAYIHFSNIQDNSVADFPVKREDFRVKIGDFQFTGYKGNKKVIRINADTFTVKKKKIGFFRTSLFNTALIKNAVIDIYSSATGVRENKMFSADSSPGISYADVFSQGALPTNSIKNISSLSISPVRINLYADNSLLTSVEADSAKMRIREKDILFESNVTIRSGEKELRADEVAFSPETSIFRVILPESNTEQIPDKENVQVVDIYLNKIDF